MITLLTASTNGLRVRFCKNHVSKRPSMWHESASERWCIFCFKDLNKTFHILPWRKKITFEALFHLNTFGDKSSQVLTLFHFVMYICQETEIGYSYSKVMAVKQWNLTAFHFLCVLTIHSSESLSLSVQLEIGRIQKIKLAKNCPILGIILHFREVAWLSHC